MFDRVFTTFYLFSIGYHVRGHLDTTNLRQSYLVVTGDRVPNTLFVSPGEHYSPSDLLKSRSISFLAKMEMRNTGLESDALI